MLKNSVEHDCRAALQQLRGAWIDLYAAIGADPHSPQDVARQFGLNKNLTWKLSKVLVAEDALSTVPNLPGGPGVDIALRSFEGAGAPAQLIQRVREAVEGFDGVVERHAGDRANLDLMLDGLGVVGGVPLEASREMAFKGNSGVWGVQAKARVMVACLSPNRLDDGKVDMAVVAGFLSLRCLRAGISWPLFKFERYEGPAADKQAETDTTLDGEPLSTGSMLIRSMGTLRPESIAERREGSIVEYSVQSDIVGNTGAFDTFFGRIGRGLPRYRNEDHESGAAASIMPVPVETLLFDLIVHRDVEVGNPRAAVYAMPAIGAGAPGRMRDEHLLPLAERFVEMAGRPPVLATTISPRHAELTNLVCERMGHAPEMFRAWRLVLPYPPMGSFVMARWDLPVRNA